MFTLGIHGGTNTSSRVTLPTPPNWLHDAAAALCRDGQVVAAAEEERFTRIKHASYFPVEAIRYCLASERIGLADVSRIVLSSEHMNEFLQIENRWRHGTRWWLEQTGFVPFASKVLLREFGVDTGDKWMIAGHHRSHALSAIYHAGFSECLCVVLDGRGDWMSGLVASYQHDQLTVLRVLRDLGPAAMYLRATELIGFSQFDEYKVMGLAPYGTSTTTDADARRLVKLGDNGEFDISIPAVVMAGAAHGAFRRRDSEIEDRHTRFAAAVQRAAEQAVSHLVRHFKTTTGHRYLCLAGGLAQNCTINGKLLTSGLFDDVFVHPAAYDAGCAIGAAIYGYLQSTNTLRPKRIADVYWGIETPDRAALSEFLRSWEPVVDVELPDDICAATARLLAEGHIVGWFQGRAEFGARALGNRSILADPRPAGNKQRINAMIKKREAFRPFAPSVLEEHLHDYFDVPPAVRSLPFMTFVVDVKQCYRQMLAAVTHVDGTARVQSVSTESNERYWHLIKAFQDITGVPVVLNTSFNSGPEPIVNTPLDAMNCYLSTGIDDLALGDYLVRRKHPAGGREVLDVLVPRLAHRFALTQSADARGRLEPGIQDRYTNDPVPIAPEAHRCLWRAIEQGRPLGAVLADMRMAPDATDRVASELWNLWERRIFVAGRAAACGQA